MKFTSSCVLAVAVAALSSAGSFNSVVNAEESDIFDVTFTPGSGLLSVIGGGTDNIASGNFTTVGGGVNNEATTLYSAIGGGNSNVIAANPAAAADEEEGVNQVIGGGNNNRILSSSGSTIVGGDGNAINGLGELSRECTIGGGVQNAIDGDSQKSTIIGGKFNVIGLDADGKENGAEGGVIGGGLRNRIDDGKSSVIIGGKSNTVTGQYSVVAGGEGNTVSGDNSVALGRRITATDNRSFTINMTKDPLTSGGEGAFRAKASEYVFHIENKIATIDEVTILNLIDVLAGAPQRRTRGLQEEIETVGTLRQKIQDQNEILQEQDIGMENLRAEIHDLIIQQRQQVEVSGYQVSGYQYDDDDDDENRLLQVTPDGDGSHVAGGRGNLAKAANAVVGGGENNAARAVDSVIGGGLDNIINKSADYGYIGGGDTNFLSGPHSAIGGGSDNRISAASGGFIGGGRTNRIEPKAINSVIGGGNANTITESAENAYIGGGSGNTAGGKNSVVAGGSDNQALGPNSAVLGGSQNNAIGGSSFAMGTKATAPLQGSMAIGLSTSEQATETTKAGQVYIRCSSVLISLGDTAAEKVTINADNVQKFIDILEGTTRRRLERSDRRQKRKRRQTRALRHVGATASAIASHQEEEEKEELLERLHLEYEGQVQLVADQQNETRDLENELKEHLNK